MHNSKGKKPFHGGYFLPSDIAKPQNKELSVTKKTCIIANKIKTLL